MRKRNGITFVLALMLVAGPVFAEASAPEKEPAVSVGELSVKLAGMLTGKDYDAEGARAVLLQLGVELEGPDGTDVDQAYLIDALGQAGLGLRTATPSRAVTQGDLAVVSALFQLERNGPQDPCPPGFPGQSCNAVQCKGGANDGDLCFADGNCPGGFCKVPPGLAKMIASPN